ncbi:MULTISPECIES: WGR domain-containing protein [unclassified Rhizobium]|uniref:WGR domain-containing protein n=1 Tax=unclassified Rhizobium TaxID=2613769 RepID=UPI001ADCC94C|nr:MULTISPECIES: WGR domain-containing protein [unclassified Rhizobium]MBO9127733.1 WGR domain-containing protein [Rhizobium sp. 16-488-2b]MBO9178195.1 WGR domain-containing protein [Rhizobium sp. 16-488-2a]
MIQPYRIHIERRDFKRNMARFYSLSIEPDLFGGAALVRRWGRIGKSGQRRIDLHAGEDAAVRQFLLLLGAKRRRGYRPVGDGL